MKTFIISLTYLVVSSSFVFSQSGWIQQTSGINTSLRSLYFINASTGWIVGDSGKILHTINGGTIWVLQNSNTTHPISKVILQMQLAELLWGNITNIIHGVNKV